MTSEVQNENPEEGHVSSLSKERYSPVGTRSRSTAPLELDRV